MDLIGLVDKIHDAATGIDYGRKGFATRGKAEEGRLSYEHGIAAALSAFKAALIALEIVENSVNYQNADKTYPRNAKYRINGFPKDSFHIACLAHRTRIRNMLRTPGIDPIEKALLKQRFANLATGQKGYMEKQRKALTAVKNAKKDTE